MASAWVNLNLDGSEKGRGHVEGIENGWFTETTTTTTTQAPGKKVSLAPLEDASPGKSVLFSALSDVQSVLVFQSAQYGKVLVLDGAIQMTERDEFSLHEMLVHLPMCSAEAEPASVLIFGGDDGGALRQVISQYGNTVYKIVVVERDPVVIQVARDYFGAAPYFDDERVTVVRAAGAAAYLADPAVAGRFHAILAGGSPIRPVEPPPSSSTTTTTSQSSELYDASMNRALVPGGVVCVQLPASAWAHWESAADSVARCREIFGTAECATTVVPSCGQIGFILARKRSYFTKQSGSCRTAVRKPSQMDQLKWYSDDMHRAAFVLPPFVAKQLGVFQDGNDVAERPHLLSGENGERGLQETEEDADEEIRECYLKNVVVLPPSVTNVFASFHASASVVSGEEDSDREEKKCFLIQPPQCTIQ